MVFRPALGVRMAFRPALVHQCRLGAHLSTPFVRPLRPLSTSAGGATRATWEAAGRKQASYVAAGLYTYRWAIIANTACTLQLVQWTMEDVIWLRTMNCIANAFYCCCNLRMGAW
jgi:hypothetical protein